MIGYKIVFWWLAVFRRKSTHYIMHSCIDDVCVCNVTLPTHIMALQPISVLGDKREKLRQVFITTGRTVLILVSPSRIKSF